MFNSKRSANKDLQVREIPYKDYKKDFDYWEDGSDRLKSSEYCLYDSDYKALSVDEFVDHI